MGALKPWHIIVFVVVLVLLFGAKRLPDSARALGKSLRILKSEVGAMKDDKKDAGAPTTVASTAEETVAPKTISSAPGETAAARPVDEKQPSAN